MKKILSTLNTYNAHRPMSDDDYTDIMKSTRKWNSRLSKLKILTFILLVGAAISTMAAIFFLSFFLSAENLSAANKLSVIMPVFALSGIVLMTIYNRLNDRQHIIRHFLDELTIEQMKELLHPTVNKIPVIEGYLSKFSTGILFRPFVQLDYQIIMAEHQKHTVNQQQDKVKADFKSLIGSHAESV